MKKQIFSALALAAAIGAMSGAALAQNVAIVNGVAIPKERIDALAQQVARSGRQITPEMQGQLRDEVIAREIFAQEAHNKGLDATDDYKNQIELTKQSILIRELFTDFQKNNAVSDEEAKAEYDKFASANAGKEYKARHILVEKEADAVDIISKIKKGAKFEDLAKKLSKDPGSGAKGGDLDWANPGNYVKEFSEALVALQKGKMTEKPVKSQFGYHIIRLDDVRDAQLPKFEDVKPQIAQQLLQQKMAKYQEELRAKAKIE
ncbi:peptidylprolyl isomerase [Rhodoferax sp. GW822-FHT02A01]|uniref:peptidylprolyl isomerase n=1 Tax=Rhodoferax sp. GW822-FHT02A01 TaxID=3141537 RepID=UPI00315DA81D